MRHMDRPNEQKKEDAKKQQSWLWTASGLLFVAICVSVALLASILKGHAVKDKNAIALVPKNVESTVVEDAEKAESIVSAVQEANEIRNAQAGSGSLTNTVQQGGQQGTNSNHPQTTIENYWEETVLTPLNPDMQVSDNTTVWETNTEVDIFKIRYVNGEGIVTVDGGDDKVIAPGTGNTYTFNLKNTGNTSLDYIMEMEAYFTPSTHAIPVVARLKGYDGNYMIGGDDQWNDILDINNAKDAATLNVNCYAYYTLEWQWPYESGNDEYDTFLGNKATEEDLTLTIVIRTTATGEDMTTEIIKVPALDITTGDNAQVILWIAMTAAAALLMILWIVLKRRREKEEENEQD